VARRYRAVLAVHPRDVGNAEVGLLDDRARKSVHLRLLNVDQQLFG